MQHACKDIAQTRGTDTQTERIHETECGLTRVLLQLKGDERARVWRAERAPDGLLGLWRGKAGVVDALKARMPYQVMSQAQCISALALDAHGKRLHPAQNFVRFPDAENPSGKFHHTDQRRKVQLVTNHDHTAHRVRVP